MFHGPVADARSLFFFETEKMTGFLQVFCKKGSCMTDFLQKSFIFPLDITG